VTCPLPGITIATLTLSAPVVVADAVLPLADA
jgi:hypothetical protein